MDYTDVLALLVASDASVDLVVVLRCVDCFPVSFQGLGLDFRLAKVSQAVVPSAQTTQPLDALQAAFPARRVAVALALRLAVHHSTLRRSAEFPALAGGSAYSPVVLSEQMRPQEPLVSRLAVRQLVFQLEESVALSEQAQESLALESPVERRPLAQRVWQPAPEQQRLAAQLALVSAQPPVLGKQLPVPLRLAREQPQAASSPLSPPLPSLLYRPWRQLPLRLQPRPVLKSFCELSRLRLPGSNSSEFFSR